MSRRGEAERVVDRARRDLVVAREAGEDRQAGGVGRGPAGRAELVRAQVPDRARAGRPAARRCGAARRARRACRCRGRRSARGGRRRRVRVALDRDVRRDRVRAPCRTRRRSRTRRATSASCCPRRRRTGSRSAGRRRGPSRSRRARARRARSSAISVAESFATGRRSTALVPDARGGEDGAAADRRRRAGAAAAAAVTARRQREQTRRERQYRPRPAAPNRSDELAADRDRDRVRPVGGAEPLARLRTCVRTVSEPIPSREAISSSWSPAREASAPRARGR